MSSAECRFRPAMDFIVPSSPSSGHRTLKPAGLVHRGHATRTGLAAANPRSATADGPGQTILTWLKRRTWHGGSAVASFATDSRGEWVASELGLKIVLIPIVFL